MEELEKIKEIMGHLLLCQTGKNGAWKPIKGTTKQQCYDALGAIQKILGTNVVHYEQGNKDA